MAVAFVLSGTGCEEGQKIDNRPPLERKEAVKPPEGARGHSAKEEGPKAIKKADSSVEKGRASGQPAGTAGQGREVDTRLYELRLYLDSPDRMMRDFAVLSMLRSNDKAAIDLLLSMMMGNAPDEIRLSIIKAFQFEKNEAATEQLLSLLSDQNASPDIRHAAAEALGASQSGQAIGRMTQVLADVTKPAATRAAVADALGKTGEPQAVESLIGILSESDPVLRRAAADALVAITWEKELGEDQRKWQDWWELHKHMTKGHLLAMANKLLQGQVIALAGTVGKLSDALADARIRDLDNRPDKNDPSPLVKEADNLNSKVQIYVAQELGKIKKNEAAFTTLVKMFSDKKEDVRIAVATALGESGDSRAVDRLIEKLKSDPEPRVRVACAEAFQKWPSPKALNQLLDSLSDENIKVSAASASALGELGDAGAVDRLVAVMVDTKRPAETREAAAGALGKLRDRKAVAPLIEMLRDRDDLLRWLATEALGKLGDAEAVSPLCHEVLADGSPNVRERAAISLGELRGKAAIDPLCKAVNDGEPSVSKAAIDALLTIAGDDGERLMQVGQLLMAKPDYGSAARFFEKVGEKYAEKRENEADYWRAKEFLAQCYVKMDEWKKARPILEELYKRDPTRGDLRMLLARARIQDKEYKSAAELYVEGLKQTPPEQAQELWNAMCKLLDEHFSRMPATDVLGIIQAAEDVDKNFGGDALCAKFLKLRTRAEQPK